MSDAIIDFLAHARLREGETRIPCPACSPDRKGFNQKEPCLSVNKDCDGKLVFHCWHCDAKGVYRPPGLASLGQPERRDRTFRRSSSSARRWLNGRGISDKTIDEQKIRGSSFGMIPAVAFPYRGGFKIQGIERDQRGKWPRRIQGTLDSMMGSDRLDHSLSTLVICEGETDYLSLVEAGVKNALSVPHGAVNPGTEDGGAKLAFLSNDFDLFKGKTRVILALDGDASGDAMAELLARRIGKARCYRVAYPDGYKDANEILVGIGPDTLKQIIEDAAPYHIPGLAGPKDYAQDLMRFRRGEIGQGYDTGIKGLDRLFTMAPGCVTVVTGHPGSGKSELVDWFHFWAMERHGWPIGAWSSENPPHMHVAKFLQKKLGCSFLSMSDEEIERGMDWLEGKLAILNQDEDPTIESILERMSAAVLRHGIRSCVIDPFNEILLAGTQREDKEIAELLGKVTRWAKSHDCHVFFVAHPRNLPPDEIPKGHHIAGGAPWRAKADFGLTMHRPADSLHSEVHIWKVRHSHLGQVGNVEVRFDAKTGHFHDPNAEIPFEERQPRYSLWDGDEDDRGFNIN
ncbi:toprim domain-containing protein [bacterium]|nr:toprim domain-containing protein [bacterium]